MCGIFNLPSQHSQPPAADNPKKYNFSSLKMLKKLFLTSVV